MTSVYIQDERSELGLHDNMCVVRAMWNVMELTGIECDVYPYSDSCKPLKQVPVVEVVTAYNHLTGETFILALVQVLNLGD